jgi:hypothetical protein
VLPVQLRDGALSQFLHPGAEVLPALDPPRRVLVQDRRGFLPGSAWPDQAADPRLLGALLAISSQLQA